MKAHNFVTSEAEENFNECVKEAEEIWSQITKLTSKAGYPEERFIAEWFLAKMSTTYPYTTAAYMKQIFKELVLHMIDSTDEDIVEAVVSVGEDNV